MSNLRSPLHDLHAELGARFVPFAGWEMPVQFKSIIEEHLVVRGHAGLFDVSHMGEVLFEGPQAEAFLDYLLTNRIAGMREGRCVYSPMCQPDGGVVDDVIAMRMGERKFLVVVNASNREKDLAWMREQAAGFDCAVTDVSEQHALMALQGPQAEDILQSVLTPGATGIHTHAGDAQTSSSNLKFLKRFHFWRDTVGGVPCIISRTGYTGEDGFEIFCAPDKATALANAILNAGVPVGLLPCGLGARDSLRLEAGYPLYGHEISATLTPLHAGLDWTVKFDKPDFIGKAALAKLRNGSLRMKIVHYKLEGRRIARDGTPVLCRGSECGKVLSGAYSAVLEKPIGSALVDVSALGGELSVDLRGNISKLEVAKPPLHLV